MWALGYATELDNGETASMTNNCTVTGTPDTNRFTTNCDANKGASGGPIIFTNPAGDYWHAGVISTSTTSNTKAVDDENLLCWLRTELYGDCTTTPTPEYIPQTTLSCPQHLERIDQAECPEIGKTCQKKVMGLCVTGWVTNLSPSSCSNTDLAVGDLCEADDRCNTAGWRCVIDPTNCFEGEETNNCPTDGNNYQTSNDIYRVICPSSLTLVTSCPADTSSLPACDAYGVASGDYCEGSGECMTDDNADNCGTDDVYLVG